MKKLLFPVTLTLLMVLFSCEDPWDKHLDEFSTDKATQNLLEIIQGTPELSRFSQLITDSQLEDLFTVSQVNTVWAPDNDALEGLSADITDNSEELVRFIENHMTQGMYPQSSSQTEIRCKMLSGKRIPMNMAVGTIYGKTITGDYNHIATNGILHIITETIELRPSIWEYVEAAGQGNEEIDFLNSLSGYVFVDSLADIIDYDSLSNPVYDTLSGTIWYNQFLFENADLRNEDSVFTLLIVENDVFDSQYELFGPYYKIKTTDPRDTSVLIRYNLCIDLVASGAWKPEDVAGELTTVNGINVPFTQGAVLETIEASNGYVYRISTCDLTRENKFPPIIVEGEDPDLIYFPTTAKPGFTRNRPLAHNGYDYVFDNHGGNPGRIVYNAGMVAATTYKFYWVAVDDFEGAYYGTKPDSLIRQKLNKLTYLPTQPLDYRFPVHRQISDSLLYVVDLSYETAEERYAGKVKFDYYQDFWFDLTGSGKNTTITLDYVRIVPVFE